MSEATKRNLRPESLTLIELDQLETAVINNDFIQKEHLLAALRMARQHRSAASETSAQQDAARYRWLRDKSNHKANLYEGGRAAVMIGNYGEALDAEIDRRMA